MRGLDGQVGSTAKADVVMGFRIRYRGCVWVMQTAAAAPSNTTLMVWVVRVRPYNGLGGDVRAFTSALVTTLARNLKSHARDGPGAGSAANRCSKSIRTRGSVVSSTRI
eukprot:scaffold15695_cov160-Amphora_coffeaeformis.AAC.3